MISVHEVVDHGASLEVRALAMGLDTWSATGNFLASSTVRSNRWRTDRRCRNYRGKQDHPTKKNPKTPPTDDLKPRPHSRSESPSRIFEQHVVSKF